MTENIMSEEHYNELLKAYTKAVSDGQAIKATPDEIQVLESLAAALRVQENIKATIKLEEHLA